MNPSSAAGRRRREALSWWSKSGLPLLLVLVAGAAPPSITEIEIVPSSVFVHHDRDATSFELEARLWTGDPHDRRSITESQGYTLTWASSHPSWLKVTNQQGFRARFSIEQEVQGTATVTAQAGGKVSLPTTVVVVTGPGAGEDFLTATYTPGKVPDVVVVNGVRDAAGAPCGVTFAAFVAGVSVGDVVGPCGGVDGAWEAAVLSVDHQAVVVSGQWTQQQNTVKAGDLQQSPRIIPLALRVMVGDDALSADELAELREGAMEMALAEIEAANGVLTTTRAGVELAKPDTATILPTATEVNADGEVVVAGCLAADELTSTHDIAGKLNVYYVNRLPGARGWACPSHRWRKQPLIFIEVHEALQTTLIHEVGHALGLTLPEDGHSDIVGGLDISNVMTKGYRDYDPGGRRRLTVGQVFRMNTDSASWLNWAKDATDAPVRESAAPRLACQCGVADPAGRCPRVADDAARRSAVTDATDAWDCWDKLMIRNAPAYERPVAIIAGRRWRAPPEDCSPYLPGWEANHWGGIWVAFDNLTRPGDCDSWAVLFFRRHGVRFVDLSEPDFSLTQVSDELVVTGFLTKPLPVRVRLYNSTVAPALVDQDVDYAEAVFGPLNRSGISLLFDLNTTACPQAGPKPGEVQVCYVAGMTREGTLTQPRRIRVGKRTGTTLSHFIGRALGLAALNPPGPNLPGNIMQSMPASRGKKLTLGQVFRINAALGVLSGCNPTPCPPVDMDVAP